MLLAAMITSYRLCILSWVAGPVGTGGSVNRPAAPALRFLIVRL